MHNERGGERPDLQADVRVAGRKLAAASENLVNGSLFTNPDASLAIANLIAGMDPMKFDRTSPSYASGASDALSSVLSGIQERAAAPDVMVELQKDDRMKILKAIAENPGINPFSLANIVSEGEEIRAGDLLGLKISVEVLEKIGFIEPALPIGSDYKAWALSSFGIKIYARLEAARTEETLKKRIESAKRTAQLISSMERGVAAEKAGGK